MTVSRSTVSQAFSLLGGVPSYKSPSNSNNSIFTMWKSTSGSVPEHSTVFQHPLLTSHFSSHMKPHFLPICCYLELMWINHYHTTTWDCFHSSLHKLYVAGSEKRGNFAQILNFDFKELITFKGCNSYRFETCYEYSYQGCCQLLLIVMITFLGWT